MSQITPDGKKIGDFWEAHVDNKANYIRSYDMQNPSRPWTIEQLRDGESLLDVGCGPATVYEDILQSGKNIRYTGVDVTPGFVEVSRELFPGVDFRIADAMQLPFDDDSYDTVLLRHVLEHTPHYEQPVREALRIAKRRVIIVMWRPLLDGDKPTRLQWEETGSNDYNGLEFYHFLDSFVLPRTPITFSDAGNQRPNWGWVLTKTLYRTVFDLDDFVTHAENYELLDVLKEQYPKLKVTLFGIPDRLMPGFASRYSKRDWIELAVHGFTHEPNTECERWTYDEAMENLEKSEKMGCFVKGFRPPGWRVNTEVLRALADRGYWISAHGDLPMRRRVSAAGLPCFYAHDNPESVHGHMQHIHHDNPYLRNGLRQLIYERGLPWDQDTEFLFCSEALDAPTDY